jgi:hypothetical protein
MGGLQIVDAFRIISPCRQPSWTIPTRSTRGLTPGRTAAGSLPCHLLSDAKCFMMISKTPMTITPHREVAMQLSSTLKHPSAFLPLAMSFGALAMLLAYLAVHGPAAQPDENAVAHMWQLLMAGQAPIVLFFAIRWVPRAPRHALPVLALQVGAALAAMAPVFLLRW